jgi:hypothetical protein
LSSAGSHLGGCIAFARINIGTQKRSVLPFQLVAAADEVIE